MKNSNRRSIAANRNSLRTLSQTEVTNQHMTLDLPITLLIRIPKVSLPKILYPTHWLSEMVTDLSQTERLKEAPFTKVNLVNKLLTQLLPVVILN